MSIVSITGGKGGVGKSSVAVNLALGLSSLGGRILLLDGDLGMANADQLLGIHVSSTLWDVVQGYIELEEAIAETPWGISLLPACSGRQEMANLDEISRASILKQVMELREMYDFVIIDTAAGIGEVSINFASVGDLVLAVATPDPTSVRDVFAIMKVLSKEKGVKRISLVTNMVSSQAEGVDLFRRISSVAGRFLPLTLGLGGIIMRDPNVRRAVRERLPLVSAYPESIASKQFAKLASHVVTLERELSKDISTPRGKGRD